MASVTSAVSNSPRSPHYGHLSSDDTTRSSRLRRTHSFCSADSYEFRPRSPSPAHSLGSPLVEPTPKSFSTSLRDYARLWCNDVDYRRCTCVVWGNELGKGLLAGGYFVLLDVLKVGDVSWSLLALVAFQLLDTIVGVIGQLYAAHHRDIATNKAAREAQALSAAQADDRRFLEAARYLHFDRAKVEAVRHALALQEAQAVAAAERRARIEGARYAKRLMRCGVADGVIATGFIGTALSIAFLNFGGIALVAVMTVLKLFQGVNTAYESGSWNCVKLFIGQPETRQQQSQTKFFISGIEFGVQAVVFSLATFAVYQTSMALAGLGSVVFLAVTLGSLGIGGLLTCLPKLYFWKFAQTPMDAPGCATEARRQLKRRTNS